MIRRPYFMGNLRQASISAAMFHFLSTGISRARCSSVVAFSDTANLTRVSSPRRWMFGTSPEVLTVTWRWLKFAPSGWSSRSSERFTLT